jgi:hypothetical protein
MMSVGMVTDPSRGGIAVQSVSRSWVMRISGEASRAISTNSWMVCSESGSLKTFAMNQRANAGQSVRQP